MLASLMAQFDFATQEDESYFHPIYLKRMILIHLLDHIEVWKPKLMEEIMGQYGAVDEGAFSKKGPYSVKTWFEHQAEHQSWADGLIMLGFASLFGAKVSVLRLDTLKVECIRHKSDDLETIPFPIMFNSKLINGHYNAIISTKMWKVRVSVVQKNQGFEESVDMLERHRRGESHPEFLGIYQEVRKKAQKESRKRFADEGEIVVSESRWKELLEKEKLLGYMQKRLSKLEATQVVPIVPASTATSTSEQPEIMSPEEEESPPDFEAGALSCPKCDKDFTTPGGLENHILRFHKHDARFRCEICGKGCGTKEALVLHMNLHTGEKGQFVCEEDRCGKVCHSKKALQIHSEIHKPKKEQEKFFCKHKCKVSFRTKGMRTAHEKGCKKNPDIKWFFCEIKGKDGEKCKYKHFLEKKITLHRVNKHGWPKGKYVKPRSSDDM